MSKTIWCNQGWFQGVFHYGFCPDEKSWDKEMKVFKRNDSYLDSCGRATFLEDSSGKRVVLVTLKDGIENDHSPAEVACVLVHEAVHVWQELCNFIGEESPSAEFEAYSIQRISQELLKAFEKTRRPLDKCGKVTE